MNTTTLTRKEKQFIKRLSQKTKTTDQDVINFLQSKSFITYHPTRENAISEAFCTHIENERLSKIEAIKVKLKQIEPVPCPIPNCDGEQISHTPTKYKHHTWKCTKGGLIHYKAWRWAMTRNKAEKGDEEQLNKYALEGVTLYEKIEEKLSQEST